MATLSVFMLAPCALGQTPWAEGSTASGPVWVIPIEGTIDIGLSEFVRRVVAEAEASQAGLLLLEINTFGGRVDAATEIRDALVGTRTPTAAYIRNRAISAGALIALATERIVMAPGATFGAAEPRPLDEKTLSYVRGEFEATAERSGRDPKVAAAMVDTSVAIPDLTEVGEILTLTTTTATQVGYADHVAGTRTQALDFLGTGSAQVVETEPSWAERLVRFLTDPTVSQILLTIGVLGLLAELSSPGLGIGGFVGLLSLALFFGSRLIVGILGVEAILLFLLGLVLLVVEVFIIPGFGVAGILGLLSVGASMFMSFPDPRSAIQAIAITVVAVVVVVLFFLKRFQKSSLWGRVILSQQQDGDEYRPASIDYTSLVGATGQARTQLRPSGSVEVNGEFYDAVSEGAMIPVGATVRIIKVEGTRIVVRAVSSSE